MNKWAAKGFTIYDEETGLRIALIDNKGWPNVTAEANTRLIAAAPEMYKLLQVICKEIPIIAGDSRHDELYLAISQADYLLARIDGENEAK